MQGKTAIRVSVATAAEAGALMISRGQGRFLCVVIILVGHVSSHWFMGLRGSAQECGHTLSLPVRKGVSKVPRRLSDSKISE